MSRATNLECADNGGALDFLAFSGSANPKRRRATLAAALQISFQQPLEWLWPKTRKMIVRQILGSAGALGRIERASANNNLDSGFLGICACCARVCGRGRPRSQCQGAPSALDRVFGQSRAPTTAAL